MKNLCTYTFRLLLPVLLLVSLQVGAQKNKVYRAQTLLSEKKIDQAKLCIDSAMANPEAASMYEAHTVKAYIYFELFKRTNRNSPVNFLRDSIINALKTSNSLNPDEDYKSNNAKLLVNIASNYYNIAKALLQDSVNFERSVIYFDKYKEVMKMAEPTFNTSEKDKEFYLAAGSIYSDRYNRDNSDNRSLEIAKVALLKVIEIQPDEPSANFNMGLMYLNTAINMIQKMDDTPDFNQLDVIMDNYIKLAKQAEQFILKVYQKNNKNPKSVEALYYVYRILSDESKKAEFKNKCKELNIPISDN